MGCEPKLDLETGRRECEKDENGERVLKRYWITFAGLDMIIDTKIEDFNEQLCIINFLPNKDDYWVFG